MPVTDLATFSLSALVSTFAIVDPIAAIPPFLAMTVGEPPERRRRMARRACVTVALLLSAFSLGGEYLFRWFGVSLPAFQIAGGALLFIVGLQMVHARASPTRETPDELAEGVEKEDVALVPLAVPLLCGPGAMANAAILSGRAATVAEHAAIHAAHAATALASYLLLRGAGVVQRVLGRTGLNVVGRLMGLFLAAIAVELVLDGLRGGFPGR